MKKFLKKLEIKPILFSIGLIGFQSLSFLFVKLFQGKTHLLNSSIDDKIQFLSIFILIYCLWYVLIFITPYYYYKRDKRVFYKYVTSYIISIIISSIVFVIYPTEVIRPTLENNNLFNIMTNIIYWVDNPAINCLPSMHCAISMLFILSAFDSKKTTVSYRLFISLSSIGIMLSTLFVKQHVMIDLITGNIMMTIIYLIVSYNPKLLNKVEKILKF